MKKRIIVTIFAVCLAIAVLIPYTLQLAVSAKELDDIIYIFTPNGLYQVQCIIYTELTLDQIVECIGEKSREYGNSITLLSVPSGRYNCHSYAWYSQDVQTNHYWIPSPSPYYANQYKDYEESTGQVGDIICYFDASGNILHSGIVVARQEGTPNGVCGDANLVTVHSKWGDYALYEHQGDNCPYVSTHERDATYVKYYRLHTNHSLEYVLVGGTTYKEMCSYCGIQVHAHASLYVSTGNGSQHSYSCSTSGCDYVAYESHTYGSSISSYDATAHYHACTVCGYEQGQNHTMQCNHMNGTLHYYGCTICPYTSITEAHSYSIIPIDDSYHNTACIGCGYVPDTSTQAPHIWKTVGNRFVCRICGLSRSTGGGPVPEPYGMEPEIE